MTTTNPSSETTGTAPVTIGVNGAGETLTRRRCLTCGGPHLPQALSKRRPNAGQ